MIQLNRTTLFRCLIRIFKIGLLGCFLYALINLLNYIYTDASSSINYRLLWHDYYENQGTIDIIYLGSSHVYHDIDPQTMDALSGLHNFDMASPSQLLNGSYYLLKQADNDNDLSHVYLELYYMCSSVSNASNRLDNITNPTLNSRNWQNIDYMKFSGNKLAYIRSCLYDIDYLPDILFPFIRYREELNDWDYIKANLEAKSDVEYRSYSYYKEFDENNYDEYRKGGFLYSTRTYKEESRLLNQSSTRVLSENPIGELSEAYLRRIIEYCQKEDIPITLFVSPMDNLRLISTLHYDNYITQVSEIASEYNVDFYDFNLMKSQYLDLDKDVCFRDNNHLNAAGAALFTPVLYQVLTGSAEQNASLFYTSYAEKLANTEPDFYGLYYTTEETEDGERTKTYHIASNRADMEYRIIITPDEESEQSEQYWLQDFSANAVFTLPASESGICTIVARMPDQPDEIIETMEINF